MLNKQTTPTTPRLDDRDDVATDPRHGFFKEFRFSWNGPHYQELLEDMFRCYVVSNDFCEQDDSKRVDDVYHLYQMKEILAKMSKVMRKEVSHG